MLSLTHTLLDVNLCSVIIFLSLQWFIQYLGKTVHLMSFYLQYYYLYNTIFSISPFSYWAVM